MEGNDLEHLSGASCGGLSAPRLEIHQAWWAMIGLGNEGEEWSSEEKFERMDQAGFTGVLGTSAEIKNGLGWVELVKRHQFRWGIGLGPWDGQHLIHYMKRAKELGASYANVQPGNAFMVGKEALGFLQETMEAAEGIGLPCYIETHRGRITQDLLRTAEYVASLPAMRLTIDFSHYVLAGEMQLGDSKSEVYFDQLLRRCSSMHLRVSNGQQIQVEVDQDYDNNPLVQHFVGWWRKGAEYWRTNARLGDILPVVCELGPPDYSLTRSAGNEKLELSDRWQQALLLKEIAEKNIVR